MNEPKLSPDATAPASREDMFAALFANMVVQHSNMALMCLGKVPHPESGEMVQDIDSAKMLIDQLEMLAAKTKGNLDKREEALLKQALASVRMAFVEVIDGSADASPTDTSRPPSANAAPPTDQGQAEAVTEAPPAASAAGSPPADSESRKKFSKKY